jgi:hypothetical protein
MVRDGAGSLAAAVAATRGARVSVGDVAASAGGRAFGLLLLVFTLPNFGLIPSVPLLPLVCGLPAILLGGQLALGRRSPWLPGWASGLSARRATAEKLAALGDRVAGLGRPRGSWVLRGAPLRVIGAVVIVLTAVLCAPVPGLNIIPGLGMVALAAGVFCGDGLLAACGTAIGLAGCAGAGWLLWALAGAFPG